MSGPLLVIDAATYRGTVAVIDGSRVLAEGEIQMRGEREERLMPAVAEALASAHVQLDSLAGVVCGGGPGSFTSLRIAAAIAKGLATAANVSLYQVPSLLLVVAGRTDAAAPGRYLVLLDAMRGDVFAGRVVVEADGSASLEGSVELLDGASARSMAESEHRRAVGPALADAWWPHARGVARLAGTSSLRRVDLAAWEPEYGRLAEAQVKWERAHGRALPG